MRGQRAGGGIARCVRGARACASGTRCRRRGGGWLADQNPPECVVEHVREGVVGCDLGAAAVVHLTRDLVPDREGPLQLAHMEHVAGG